MTVSPVVTFAQSVPPGVTQITPDGRTATTVTTNGNVSTVTTGTISGPNAFNSFSQFKIGSGNTGNLILPNGTSNLVNLISGNDPAVVNGVLNSYRNGQIGGNVYFASPNGFVVGSTGVLNVGSLNVTTPTREFVNSVISPSGQINQGAVNNLLAGTVPISPDGNIRIRGRVNAVDAVRLTGQNVFIGGARDAVNRDHAVKFASTVNSKGLRSANAIVVRNGSIQIVAADSAKINGRLAARKAGGQGGDIVVLASGAVRIGGSARLNTRGKTADAGNIIVRAGTNLTVDSGARFTASSTAGHGGLVELSSFGTFNLAQGFKVNIGGANGKNGVLLMDPNDVVIGDTLDAGVNMSNADVANSITAIVGGGTWALSGDSITLTASGVIDGRKLDANGKSNADSVSIELDAPVLKIFGVINATTVNVSGSIWKDGDIALNASSTPQNTIAGLNTASASIEIGGNASISGAKISLNATAAATSSYTDSAQAFAALIAQSQAAALVGLNAGYVAGTSTATIAINGGTITGSGDVSITATGFEKAMDPVITLGSSSPASIAVVVGEVNGTVSTTIASGATINTNANLTIKSTNDATLGVSAIGFTTDSVTVDTVAIGIANVQTKATVANGATLSVGGNLAVVATNTNDFSVSATAIAATSGKSGIAVAYNENSTNATAKLGTRVGTNSTPTPGSVTVEANSLGSANAASAAAVSGNPPSVTLSSLAAKPIKDLLSQKVDGKAADKLKTAGAAAVSLSSQATNASITADTYATGNVSVVSRLVDAGVRSNADASTSSQNPTAATKGQTTAANALAAGVAVGQFEHNSNAFIGSGVTVSGANVGVSATTAMPITITWATYDNVETWLGKINGNLGIVNQILTSYANAASTATNLDIAGAVNYFEITNTTTAWVGSGASVTSTSFSTAPWTTTLNDGSTIAWAQSLAIQASTRTESIDIGGNFSWFGLTGTGGQTMPNGQTDTTAIGGSANAVLYNNRTVAGVGDGATLSSNASVGVAASNTDLIFSAAPTAGSGAGDAFNGIVDLALLNDFTHASISNSAQVTAPVVVLNASDAVSILAVSGAVTSSQNNAVGLVVAVNQLQGDTAAYIGVNSTDILQGKNASDDTATADGLGGGYVHADALNVQAQTYGIVQTVSVAATAASSSPSSGSSFLGKFLDFTGIDAFSGKAAAKSAAASGGTTPPKWSIDISGSSSVNVIAMATSAYLESATVAGDTTSDTTTVQAVNNVVLTAASGAAALDFATSPATKSAAVAGALAINMARNQTTAYIDNTTITSSASVSVLALAGGEQTTVGLGLALNQAADQSKAASVAGSVALSLVDDGVSAYESDSTITADPSLSLTYSNAATVAAYQTTDIGIGGGSLYKGGKTGFGFAVTYAEIGNPDGGNAVDARVSNSNITGFYNATVSASDASRIGAGAGLFGYAQNGLAVSLVISDISPTISAVVDGGTDPNGSSTITVSGTPQSYTKATSYYVNSSTPLSNTSDTIYTLIYSFGSFYTYSAVHTELVQVTSDVTVSSNGSRNAAFHAAIASTSQAGAGPVNTGLIDFSGSAVEAANSQSGASIIAVAGVVQGGQNSLGFAITANTINQDNIAKITHANVTAMDGNVIVTADSSADILGVAVGAAESQGQGKFAGLSSTAVNQISNNVSAIVGDATATNLNTTVDTTDLIVRATDSSNIRGAAGTLAIGINGSAAGLSIVYDDIANSVVAGIEGAKVVASRDVTVNSASNAEILTVALGTALSKQVGVAGSVATSILNTNVTASITGGADVSATNNVGVIADNTDTIAIISGAAGVGLTSTAVGISVVVSEVKGATSAYIGGATTQVDAYAAGASPLSVNSGVLNTAFDVSTPDDPNLTPPDLSEQQRAVHGLAVVATSHQAIDGIAVTLGLGSSAFTFDPVTSLMGGSTFAYIDGSKVDKRDPVNPSAAINQNVFVGASSQTYARNLIVAGALGGSYAGAGAIAGTRLDRSTHAYINNASVGTSARRIGDVAVNASATQVASDVAVGLAAGADGIGGTVIVNVFAADTQAYLTHGSVYASTLAVTAASENGQFAAAGSGAFGGSTGIAAGIVVGASENNTLAYIGDNNASTTVNLTGDLTVTATSGNSFYSYAIGGAGAGGTGVAGMLDFTVLNNTTKAMIDNVSDTQTGADAGVTVNAFEDVTIRAITGAGAAGGDTGVGAAINVVVLKSQVAAAIIDSDVNTTGTVAVTATGHKDIDMQTVTVGVGGTVGVAASISLLIAGVNGPSDATDQIGSTVVMVDNEASNIGSDNGIVASDVPGNTQPSGSRPADYSLAGALNSGNDAVSAEITRGTMTANDVTVTATGSVKTKNLAVGVGLAGTVGVGAALGYSLVYDTIAASVSHGVVHARNVTVSATMQDNGGHAAETDAYAGAGGLAAAVGAAIAIATVNNTVSAQLGGVVIDTGSHSDSAASVSAVDSSSVATDAVGAAIAGVAVGVSVAASTKSSLIYADVLEGSTINNYAGLSIIAVGSGSLNANSLAGAGGIAAGVGAGATSTDSEHVIAEVGTAAANAAIGAPASTDGPASISVGANGLFIQATDTPQASASAIGVAVGSFGVGASVALATVTANVAALVDQSSSITTNGTLSVLSQMLTPAGGDSANAFSAAGTGGFVLGANATDSEAINNATVTAAIGDYVVLPMGNVLVQATNVTSQTAKTTGVAAGFIGLGVAVAFATADTTTKAGLGQHVTSSASRLGTLVVSATGKDTVAADAISGVGGVVGGNGADANAIVNSNVTASIGSDSDITAGIIGIAAWHTSTYKASVNAINASVVGASGATALNDIDSNVTVDIGANTHLFALTNVCGSSTCAAAVNFVAENDYVQIGTGNTASGAGGGAFNAAAVFGKSDITGKSEIVIEDGADDMHRVEIRAGTDPFNNPGGIRMTAFSTLNATDSVDLVTGGAITVAGVNTTVDATLSNKITIGSRALLAAYGSIGLGTFTQMAVNTGAYVSTYGIAAVGSAGAFVDLTDNENVTVKNHAILTAFGNVNLTPGQDPGGYYHSVLMAGTSDAQAYVSGLIAVPTAVGETDLTTNADLLIDTGAYVGAGQNVTLGAYEGNQTPVSHGDAHGYILFLIPVKTSDSTRVPVQNSSVTIAANANVVAGQYHDQEVTIDCGAAACTSGSRPSISVGAGGAPLTYVDYTDPTKPLFDVAGYITLRYDPGVQDTLLSTVSGSSVPAFQLGTLFASGGSVTISARTLAGTGTVTAYGGPKINLVANSPAYLILNGAYIPDLAGGQVVFTGAADEASKPAGMTINRVDEGVAPVINIVNNFTGNTGTTGFGPAMLFDGDVTNLGGTITITNLGGSYGTVGNTNAQGIEVNIPNGAAVISNPGAGGYYGPINAFGGFDGLAVNYPGGTSGGPTPPSANIAAEYVANILYQSSYVGADDATKLANMNGAIYGFLNAGSEHEFAGTSGQAQVSALFFSNCIPGVSGGCTTSGYVGNYNLGTNFIIVPGVTVFGHEIVPTQYLMGNLGGSAYLERAVPFLALSATNNNVALPASGKVSTFGGGKIAIKAAVIDINAQIVVGRPANQTVTIPQTVEQQLSQYHTDYLNAVAAGGALPNPIHDIPGLVTALDAATRGIGTAVYDAANNQIIITDTNASSSGGQLTMTGAIISTSTLGNIQVNGGLGQVAIDNETSIAMVVNKINTGSLGANDTVVSTVKITDTLKAAAVNTTTYRYSAGQGVLTYITGNGVDPIYTGPNATAPSGPLNTAGNVEYDPVPGARLQWVQQAVIARDVSVGNGGTWSWAFPSDQPNNPWSFVTADALKDPTYNASTRTADSGLVSQAHPQGIVVLTGNPNGAKFSQTITGGVTNTFTYQEDQSAAGRPGGHVDSAILYYFSGFDLTGSLANLQTVATSAHGWDGGDGDQTGHIFNMPTEAWLKVTSSVKADNPFSVQFVGGTTGSVNIVSKAPVTFVDRVTNASGTTRVTAAGNITQGGDAFVNTKSLILDATGGQGVAANNATSGIGAKGTPFAATLNGGVVSATAGSGGVYMNISGSATTGKVAAVDANGYGDIDYTQHGNMFAAGGADVVPINFIGDNISLTSIGGAIGTGAAPIVISANSSLDQNGAPTGGQVDMLAQGDINFKQTNQTAGQRLDLRLGTVTSQSGDINIEVTNGALVDARGLTAADALSQDQVDAISQLLHLTAANGASQAAIDSSVKPFEAKVSSDYGRYFRLKSDACTSGCTMFVVPASAIPLYRPLAAAALKDANLTDAQVADFVATAHQQNGSLNLSGTALAIYRPLAQTALSLTSVTDDQVRAYADAQYQGIVSDFTRAYGPNWASLLKFTAQQSNFSYSVNDADAAPGLQAALTARAVWDPAQLVASIDQSALQPVSPTVGNGTPNIVGRNVTLNVGGSLGVLAAPVSIGLNSLIDGGNGPSLTAEQKAAIAAASAPGSVTPVGVDGNGATVKGFSISSIPADVTVTGVEISQQAPIFVAATGTFSANAMATAFVQSTGSSDFKIGQVVATGDVALTATKNLLAAQSNGAALFAQQVLTNGNLTLTAGNGDIGGSSLPFSYKADGHLVAAQASGSVYLAFDGFASTLGGDMTVGRVFASGMVSLTSTTGGILGYLPGLAITAHDVILNAQSGDLGAAIKPLQVQTDGGALTGTASGNAWLYSPTVSGQVPVPLTIASLSANGILSIAADGDLTAQSLTSVTGAIVVGSGGNTEVVNASISAPNGNASITVTGLNDVEVGSLTAPGRILAQAGGRLIVETGGVLTSRIGAIDVIADSLAMQANSLMSAAGTISIATVHDATVGGLVSAFAAATPDATAISVTAGDASHAGQILSNGYGQTNFTAVRPNSAVVLTAASGIGTKLAPLTVDAPWLSASASAGDIHILSLGDIHVHTLSAPGVLDLTTAGALTFDEVKGDNIVLKSNGVLNVGSVEVTSSVALEGTDIIGNVIQTPGAPGPLTVSITGPNGTLAKNAVVVIDPPVTVIPQLLAVDATITNLGPSFTVLYGYVPGQFMLNMGGQSYVMNNRSPAPLGWPAVQLYQNGTPFYFSQNNNFTYTSGFVVDYGRFANTTALSFFNGMSFVRDIPRDMWDGGVFDDDYGNSKRRSVFHALGTSPEAMLESSGGHHAVETIGDGPAVNIDGLR